jgi:hypothetical protein
MASINVLDPTQLGKPHVSSNVSSVPRPSDESAGGLRVPRCSVDDTTALDDPLPGLAGDNTRDLT